MIAYNPKQSKYFEGQKDEKACKHAGTSCGLLQAY